MRTLLTSIAVALLALPSPGLAQPVDKPNSFTFAPDERLPVEVRQTLRLRDGEINFAEGSISANEVFASIPVEFVRSGVLTEDVRGAGFLALGTVRARAGSPAFWAGRFNEARRRPVEMWCIITDVEDLDTLCLVPLGGDIHGNTLSTVASPSPSAFSPSNFTLQQQYNTQTHRPQIQLGPIQVRDDLRLEYRFREWRRDGPELEVLVGGVFAAEISGARGQDGSVQLGIGERQVTLREVAGNRQGAIVELAATPPIQTQP